MRSFAFSIIKSYPAGTVARPIKRTEGSAGYDIKCPKYSNYFKCKIFEANGGSSIACVKSDGIILKAGCRIIIPTGLRFRLPENMALISFEKSGLATKSGIVPTCRVVDSDYQGEVCVGLLNNSDKDYTIVYGNKIAQYLLMPVADDKAVEVDEDDIFSGIKSDRGSGGFGSTGY